ncbi:MAG: hypothetical protein AAB263_00220 [Planctomycetota bacterium]
MKRPVVMVIAASLSVLVVLCLGYCCTENPSAALRQGLIASTTESAARCVAQLELDVPVTATKAATWRALVTDRTAVRWSDSQSQVEVRDLALLALMEASGCGYYWAKRGQTIPTKEIISWLNPVDHLPWRYTVPRLTDAEFVLALREVDAWLVTLK